MSKQLPQNLGHGPSYIDPTILVYVFQILYITKNKILVSTNQIYRANNIDQVNNFFFEVQV